MPKPEGAKHAKKKFKQYPIGYFHVDIANVRTEEGKRYLFVAIDCTSKFVYAELHEKSDRTVASDFLSTLVKMVPYKIHTVLTDNGAQFCVQPRYRNGATARFSRHMFQIRCHEHGIEHRLTKPNHPWTNGQVERMNRTLKEATVKRDYYETHEQLKAHLCDFLNAYNFAKRLKSLKGLTPYQYIIQCWQKEPERFKMDPNHHKEGLNT